MSYMIRQLGASRPGVWVIKHIICNVNPGFERPSPWTLNIRANKTVKTQIGSQKEIYSAREATAQEVEVYWPQLVAIWPAYQRHFDKSGQRSIFILEPPGREKNS